VLQNAMMCRWGVVKNRTIGEKELSQLCLFSAIFSNVFFYLPLIEGGNINIELPDK